MKNYMDKSFMATLAAGMAVAGAAAAAADFRPSLSIIDTPTYHSIKITDYNGDGNDYAYSGGLPYLQGGAYYINIKSTVPLSIVYSSYFSNEGQFINYITDPTGNVVSAGGTLPIGDVYNMTPNGSDDLHGILNIASPPPDASYPTDFCTGCTEYDSYRRLGSNLDLEFQGDPSGTFTFSLSSVPEPATWALVLVGTGGLGGLIRRKRWKAAMAGSSL